MEKIITIDSSPEEIAEAILQHTPTPEYLLEIVLIERSEINMHDLWANPRILLGAALFRVLGSGYNDNDGRLLSYKSLGCLTQIWNDFSYQAFNKNLTDAIRLLIKKWENTTNKKFPKSSLELCRLGRLDRDTIYLFAQVQSLTDQLLNRDPPSKIRELFGDDREMYSNTIRELQNSNDPEFQWAKELKID